MPKNFLRFNTDQLPLLGGGVGASGVGGEERWREAGGGGEERFTVQILVEFPLSGQWLKFQNNGVKEL